MHSQTDVTSFHPKSIVKVSLGVTFEGFVLKVIILVCLKTSEEIKYRSRIEHLME